MQKKRNNILLHNFMSKNMSFLSQRIDSAIAKFCILLIKHIINYGIGKLQLQIKINFNKIRINFFQSYFCLLQFLSYCMVTVNNIKM